MTHDFGRILTSNSKSSVNGASKSYVKANFIQTKEVIDEISLQI